MGPKAGPEKRTNAFCRENIVQWRFQVPEPGLLNDFSFRQWISSAQCTKSEAPVLSKFLAPLPDAALRCVTPRITLKGLSQTWV